MRRIEAYAGRNGAVAWGNCCGIAIGREEAYSGGGSSFVLGKLKGEVIVGPMGDMMLEFVDWCCNVDGPGVLFS